jgi:GT2 family glycosyltransferase
MKDSPPTEFASIGIVVIGRNEGARLVKCLDSTLQQASKVVYVDSGSTDDSVAMARSKGVFVVDLDMRTPFTAARARNAGFEQLLHLEPHLAYVQFVDGDCELAPNWLSSGSNYLREHTHIAALAGRLREKFPDASVYNRLCEIEWAAPAGLARHCGGIAMMRVAAFQGVNGFDPQLICGEEPELCSRFRAQGWQIWRLTDDMAYHDAAMTHFSQWWTRTKRAGFGFAQAAFMSRNEAERRGRRESRSAWLWGLLIPLAGILLSVLWLPVGLLVWAAYPAQIARLAFRGKYSARINWLRAAFLVLGKFPEMLGQVKFMYQRYTGQQSLLIEHK